MLDFSKSETETITRSQIRPRWAPRVRPEKIRRLYELEAQDLIDVALVEDVGLTLYLRCRSILEVTRIYTEGMMPCPACHARIKLSAGVRRLEPGALARCENCNWELPWETVRATFHDRELFAVGAGEYFEEYMVAWDRARTAQERLLLIDLLIHLWHWESRQAERQVGRPFRS